MVPVVGLIQVGDQAMADRYAYLPLIGIFVAFFWGVSEFAAKAAERGSARILPVSASLLVVVLCAVTSAAASRKN